MIQTTKADFGRPVFAFNDGEDALLLRSLPLDVGYDASIVTADEMTSSDRVKRIEIRVLREEDVSDSCGAWRHLSSKRGRRVDQHPVHFKAATVLSQTSGGISGQTVPLGLQ